MYPILLNESEMELLEKFMPIMEQSMVESVQEKEGMLRVGAAVAQMALEMDSIPENLKEKSQDFLDSEQDMRVKLDEMKDRTKAWSALCNKILPSRETVNEPVEA